MCGIFVGLGSVIHDDCANCINTLRARGPEGSCVKEFEGGLIGFTRLAINGLTKEGMQPMEFGGTLTATNGEIYNWAALEEKHKLHCNSGSDCEVIGALYQHFAGKPFETLANLFNSLDGVFATAIIDYSHGYAIIARDPYGVRPLYKGTRTIYSNERVKEEQVFFASEVKALTPLCSTVTPFTPGTFEVYDISTRTLIYSATYHSTIVNPLPAFTSVEASSLAIKEALVSAVKKRMLTERPVAALLSGGLDSSLIASLVAEELRKAKAPPLKTFSIGMAGSSDLLHAKKVAEWIHSDHTEIVLTAEDFFKAIPQVIKDVESYDTTTVRASVGNWLVAKAVASNSDCKVVFNGDGADELFGSYLYMFGAPSHRAYANEVSRLLKDIHMFDVQRSDRSISSHGLEPRTPFLDKTFVQTVLQVPLEYRQPTAAIPEKWILRRAFDDGTTLPREVLWRRKEAFSDGVSGDKPWYLLAQEMATRAVDLEKVLVKYVHNPPVTPEMCYYRGIFEGFYPGMATVIPYMWMPLWSDTTDPSARTLKNY